VTSGLSHRERALAAIEGRPVDRVPTMFRADEALTDRLRAELGSGDLEDHFGVDLTHAPAKWHEFAWPDLTGMDSPADVDSAKWPDASALDMSATAAAARAARSTGRAVCGGVWASIFTTGRRLMGEEKYLLAMHLQPELIERLVSRLTDFYLEANERILLRCADDIDVFYFGSDFGTQQSMFISPEHYRRFFKPEMRRLVEQARRYDLNVMFHTCGAVSPIIGDLAEIGVDVLDPVQVSATGMTPEKLVAEFKGDIAFHGAISTQTTLPFGTAAEVRDEVRRTIDTLGPAGYIAGPDQEMIGDIPTENVIAMYEAIGGCGAP